MTFVLFPDDVPRQPIWTISHSQAGVWGMCQQRWKYNYVDRIVPKTRKETYALGTLFHRLTAVYDQLLMTGVPAGDKIAWERVYQYAEEDFFASAVEADAIQLYARAVIAAKRYILEHSAREDEGATVLGVEDHFEVEFKTPKGRPFAIQGYIDRLYRKNGKKRLLDRKTSITGKHMTDNEMLMDPQLLLYAACYREMGTPIHAIDIDSVSTYPYANYDGQKIAHIMKRISSVRSDKEMDYIITHYGALVDQMIDKLEEGTPFVRTLSRDCARCPYMEVCLYEMKGIDTSFLLEANFTTKDESDAPQTGPEIFGVQAETDS